MSNCCSERSSTQCNTCSSGSKSDAVRSLENVVTCGLKLQLLRIYKDLEIHYKQFLKLVLNSKVVW